MPCHYFEKKKKDARSYDGGHDGGRKINAGNFILGGMRRKL
jgi:hypothetical protein